MQVKKQDMTLQQLRVYDGESEACDGSICVAGVIHFLIWLIAAFVLRVTHLV